MASGSQAAKGPSQEMQAFIEREQQMAQVNSGRSLNAMPWRRCGASTLPRRRAARAPLRARSPHAPPLVATTATPAGAADDSHADG
jgi:hypothetical protein